MTERTKIWLRHRHDQQVPDGNWKRSRSHHYQHLFPAQGGRAKFNIPRSTDSLKMTCPQSTFPNTPAAGFQLPGKTKELKMKRRGDLTDPAIPNVFFTSTKHLAPGCSPSKDPNASSCGFSLKRSWKKVTGCLGRTRKYRVWINRFQFAHWLEFLTQWSLRRHVKLHAGLISTLALILFHSLQHPNGFPNE